MKFYGQLCFSIGQDSIIKVADPDVGKFQVLKIMDVREDYFLATELKGDEIENREEATRSYPKPRISDAGISKIDYWLANNELKLVKGESEWNFRAI